MSVPEESFDPKAAMVRIEQAERRVRSGRRWRAGSFAVVGLLTIGYCAALGVVRHNGSELLNTVLMALPAIVVITMAEVLGKRSAARNRRLERTEYVLAGSYVVLVVLGEVLAERLPYPLPAMLGGVPAAICWFLGAWWTVRR
jgi:hypothetical protein